MRFALDFLRAGDTRYLTLTPAQRAVVAVLAGVGAWWPAVRASSARRQVVQQME